MSIGPEHLTASFEILILAKMAAYYIDFGFTLVCGEGEILFYLVGFNCQRIAL